MVNRRSRISLLATLFATLAPFLLLSWTVWAKTPVPAAELKIAGAVSSPLVVTAADLKKMPRTTLKVVNPHDKKTEVYEGVALEELLRRAGVPQGEQLRGPLLATYVIAEAED